MLRVEQGSLYPALYRMTRKGWVTSEWGTSENNRRAKFYRLTNEGRRQFREQTSGWQRFATAVTRAVGSARAPSWAARCGWGQASQRDRRYSERLTPAHVNGARLVDE